MATIIDQVREMGLKQALVAKADEVVERVTAGLNINDVRGMLRGDEPRRPNPRLRPHADGFWFHIRPSFYHTEVTHIYPTFRLGWISTYMFVWETLTGIFLMIFYTPAPNIAYGNMWNILGNVPLGQLVRNMHRVGAEVMVLAVALHMLRTFITGSYKKPRQFTWMTGVFLLLFTLFLSFSGYLLPWDQLAYWALTVFISGGAAAPAPPVVTENILLILQGAPTLGAGGLLRWYLLHVLVLPLLTAIFFFVHYYKVVLYGISLPPSREEVGEDTAKRVPKDERTYFLPDIATSEVMWTAIGTLILTAASLWFWDAPLEHHANPLVTPLHVVAPWYLSWSQGWLKLADKTIVVGFIPLLLVAFIVMPYFEVGKSRRYADRRVGLSVCMVFIAIMLVSNWMGSPEFRVEGSPEQEVSQEMLPGEGASSLLAVPYDYLWAGQYEPGQQVAGNPYLTKALADFEEALHWNSCWYGERIEGLSECKVETFADETNRFSTLLANNAMPNPQAKLVIQPLQETLMQLTIQYEVFDPITGAELIGANSDHTSYRHKDANYEEECRFANKDC